MKNKRTFSLIFYARKAGREDLSNLYVRITVDGKRSEISLKRSVDSTKWDTVKGRVRGVSQPYQEINDFLDETYRKLLDCYTELKNAEEIITAERIKIMYLGDDIRHKTIFDLVRYHNTHMVTVLKPGTIKNYFTTEKYLRFFINEVLGRESIRLKHINYQFILEFEKFLREPDSKYNLHMTNNGVMKHLERLKKVLNLGVKMECVIATT